MKKAKCRRRRVKVLTPSGSIRVWTVPIAGFKETKAVMAKHGFHIVDGLMPDPLTITPAQLMAISAKYPKKAAE